MKILVGARLQGFGTEGGMGTVSDTLFINCFWPRLDVPTALFAVGSSGLQVIGSPTPRNVVFPADTLFPEYCPDATFSAEQAVLKAFPFRRNLVNLSPSEAQVWWDAYNAVTATLPTTCTKLRSRKDCFLLRHREERSRREVVLEKESVSVAGDGSRTILAAGTKITKIEYDEYVAELSEVEAGNLVNGNAAQRAAKETALRASKTFRKSEDGTPLVRGGR
jgi:hypothetical protein